VPQTVGWWIVLGLVMVALAWAAWAVVRRRRSNRYRRLALARLEAIERALADPTSRPSVLAELPVLVKRTALAAHARAEVAALSGDSWLEFLDRSYGGKGFTEGIGRLLPELAYATPASTSALPTEETRALVDLVRRWIRSHRVRV
jgi:hypothetical protein